MMRAPSSPYSLNATPLRAALDWLRDTLAAIFEEQAPALLKDPWKVRDAYIQVILDRSDEALASFFSTHGTGTNDDPKHVRALKLLEMQRHALLMYTSCGWFFDELSGVSWSKGCYMGQELTARTKYRGLVKRRLVPVAINGAVPEPGMPVMRSGARSPSAA